MKMPVLSRAFHVMMWNFCLGSTSNYRLNDDLTYDNVDDLLKFDWDNIDELKVNLEKWAYNDDFILMEQDEDLLFHNIEWTEIVFPFMFDEKCVKREYIISNFLDYLREIFLHRKAHEIEQIHKLFIDDMTVYYSVTNDTLIGDCIGYYLSCKQIFDTPKQVDF